MALCIHDVHKSKHQMAVVNTIWSATMMIRVLVAIESNLFCGVAEVAALFPVTRSAKNEVHLRLKEKSEDEAWAAHRSWLLHANVYGSSGPRSLSRVSSCSSPREV